MEDRLGDGIGLLILLEDELMDDNISEVAMNGWGAHVVWGKMGGCALIEFGVWGT